MIDLSGILIKVQYGNNEIYVVCVYLNIICIGNTAWIKIHGINHTHNIYFNMHIYTHILILCICIFHTCMMLTMCNSVITVHVQSAKM